ncbi:RWD domain-containing protein [Balamuthia mandrillaris]
MMELEALEAIYPEEFKKLGDSPHRFEITLVPNLSGTNNHVSIALTFTYTPTYPQEVPLLEIKPLEGVNEEDCEQLKQQLQTEAEANVGMAMVLLLAQNAKDWLDELNDKQLQRLKDKEKEEERKKKEKEIITLTDLEAEPVKIIGTPVTPETFFAWRDKFEAEMREQQKKQRMGALSGQTGLQLFQMADPSTEEIKQMLEGAEDDEGADLAVAVEKELFIAGDDIPEFSDDEEEEEEEEED